MELITAIKDIGTTIAALGGLGIAYKGLTTWRRQLRGNSDFDLARRILRATYQMRDRIRSLRNPWMPIWETAPYEEGNEASPPGISQKAINSAYSARWDNVQLVASELDALRIEAEAQWGPDFVKHLDALQDVHRKLFFALDNYIRFKSEKKDGELQMAFKEWESIVRTPPIDDTFSVKVSAAIKDIEEVVVPHIRERNQRFQWKSHLVNMRSKLNRLRSKRRISGPSK